MPIYEYRCPPCDHLFETLVRTLTDVVRCPQCGNIDVFKQFSVPAAAHSGQSASALPVCADAGPSSFGCDGGRCATGMCSMD
jgi:putative FmdB family regulatory protein